MFLLRLGLISTLVGFSICEDKKWVWDSNARSANSKSSPRYEIFEDNYGDYTDYDRPHRPHGARPYPNQRPGGHYDDDYGHHGLGHAGHQDDYEDGPGFGRPPVRQFDTCLCTQPFNCKSPSVSYGHCDAGKSYCCYNKRGGLKLDAPPSRPVHSPENGVLVGPGHGNEGFGRPDKLNHRPDVLVGPGAQYGRPQIRPGHRPHYSSDSGVLVGPGGPFDRPYAGRFDRYDSDRNKRSGTQT